MVIPGKEHHDPSRDQRGTDASDHWDRLARSFNTDYIRSARRKYALWTERDRRISKIAFETHLRNAGGNDSAGRKTGSGETGET